MLHVDLIAGPGLPCIQHTYEDYPTTLYGIGLSHRRLSARTACRCCAHVRRPAALHEVPQSAGLRSCLCSDSQTQALVVLTHFKKA